MSKRSDKLIYKSLNNSAIQGFLAFKRMLSQLRKNVSEDQYKSLAKNYLEVASDKFKKQSWTGQKNIADLGYDCVLDSVSLEKDMLFASEWLALHASEINSFILQQSKIQNSILSENYVDANNQLDQFQKNNGWSFWCLELKYFTTYKLHGIEGIKSLTQEIKDKAVDRVIGFAATMLSDRVDEKYTFHAYSSRWTDIILKYLKNLPRSRYYYLFRGLGRVDDYGKSLAECISIDFGNSIYDCYNTVLDSAMSIVASQESKDSYSAIHSSFSKMKAAGIKDFRVDKILFFVSGDLIFKGQQYANYDDKAELIAKQLANHEQGFFSELPELNSISKINKNGVAEHDSLIKLEKLAINLKPLAIGNALGGFVTNITSNRPRAIATQAWLSFASSSFSIEECFVLDEETAWIAIENIAKVSGNHNATQATTLLQVKSGIFDITHMGLISATSSLWVGNYLLSAGRFDDCTVIVEHLSKQGEYWSRQANKLTLEILCGKYELDKAIALALDVIEESAILIFEYPLYKIFENNAWVDFRDFDPILVGIVAHYTSACLLKADEDISYLCKMACRKVHLLGGRDFLASELTGEGSPRRKILVNMFSNVWVEENLTLLNFKTSREVMTERLEVLRLLVQIDPDNEQSYASEIIDITLRDTLWAGLTHIEETRVFVNEAGISRWADKELRHDFETWKEVNLIDAPEHTAVLEAQMMEYSRAPTSERLDEIRADELSDNNKLILSIMERLEARFLNDPLDGLHCYLSARIRHGTVKNTFLGPIDEGGLLVAEGKLDESCYKYFEGIDEVTLENTIKPALFELSAGLLALIDDAIQNKIRIRNDKYPSGYIEIKHDVTFFGKVAAVFGSKLDFQHFVSVAFGLFWELLKPSLMKLHDYFSVEFQEKTHLLFEEAVQKIVLPGDESRSLIAALRRIGGMTALQCTVAAKWFHSESHVSDRVFKLCEAIDIACKTSRNIYRRFNADIKTEQTECLDLPLSGVGLGGISEAINIMLENAWKYSGLGEGVYEILIEAEHDAVNNILVLTIINPLSDIRTAELTEERINQIKCKFEQDFEVEAIASEGGSGLPKIARYSYKIDKSICPKPLVIEVKNGNFIVKACIPLHKRGEMYDVYSY